MNTREYHKTKAKLYDHLDMFPNMVESISQLISSENDPKLSTEERNLFSVAFKNTIDPMRTAFRQLSRLRDTNTEEVTCEIISEVLNQQKEEIVKICNKISDIVRTLLLNDQLTDENRVFYCKMIGDYLRYKAELKTEDYPRTLHGLS
ncbi:14-3-3-like protein GF14-E, partial [Octopus sinensis]|uniref:14-3-3-like protein GF14-E n=1 Tax=Octopus sinensis TaxID=2607531 RepID=A0A6P7U1P0_9MOLL